MTHDEKPQPAAAPEPRAGTTPLASTGPAEHEPQPAATPEPGQADDKDWTWVLDRPCGECGADVGGLSVAEVATANRDIASAFAAALRTRSDVRDRPEPDVWSPLEYGAHVLDVFRLFLTRLELMLTEDDPLFANWNPNETAESDRYDLMDPAMVADDLESAADELATRFESLTPQQLDRTGRRSDGAAFSVLSFARYEIHDPIHHLWDIGG